jgi:DNA-binding transcriptional regulator WhiA
VARKWNKKERKINKDLLIKLYVKENKTIKEIGLSLGVSEKTIYKRLKTFKIKIIKFKKLNYCNKRNNIKIPKYSVELAEFFGVMLGDGHVSHFQVVVSLGNKEENYAKYVKSLLKKIFKTNVRISVRSGGYRDIYLGSVEITSWLLKQGLVFNKVKSQVDVPNWIFTKKSYCKTFIRGFFDTDGSVYKLKYGVQISFCNKSLPILKSLQLMLKKLEYSPSSISLYNMYLTRRKDVKRFFREIKPSNHKHIDRYLKIENNLRRSDSGYSRRL